MTTINDLDENKVFFNNITSNYLRSLKEHFDLSSHKTLLIEKDSLNNIVDTLVVNFSSNRLSQLISFTFLPIASTEININTLFLQIHCILTSKPKIETLNQLEKTLNFINNQLPIGHFSISNANEITLTSIQALSANNTLDANVFNSITSLFEIIVSIFNPSIDDVCSGKKTFKQLAYELSC